jgi:hypothetical protein
MSSDGRPDVWCLGRRPDHLKGKFAEVPPVFENTHVSREYIGDHMKTYVEERGIINQKRK